MNASLDQLLFDPITNAPNLLALIKNIDEEKNVPMVFAALDLVSYQEKFGQEGLIDLINVINDLSAKHALTYYTGDIIVIQLPYPLGTAQGYLWESNFIPLKKKGITEQSLRWVWAEYPRGVSDAISLLSRLYTCLRGKGGFSGEWWVDLNKKIYNYSLLLQEQATTDYVSGLPNQRAGKETLNRLIAQYHRTNEPCALLFVDGDSLKIYNENEGYAAGNEMICRLGNLLKSNIRAVDHISRWFLGDEFLILLSHTNIQKAYEVAERLRKKVEIEFKSSVYPVTVSIGISACPENGTDSDELIDFAQKANDLAKRAGKNRVK